VYYTFRSHSEREITIVKNYMEISMKLIKVLIPAILTGFVAFSAFAAEEQNAQAQGQQANAATSEQVAVSDTSANASAQSSSEKKSEAHKKTHRKKCTKCKPHKGNHAKSKDSATSDQPSQESSQAPTSN
jgi:type II secretory pathway pseudopilin PulG